LIRFDKIDAGKDGRLTRRAAIGAGMTVLVLPAVARAEPGDLEKAIRAFTKGTEPRAGKVKLDVAPLVENGNSVSVTIDVDHPMSGADRVTEIALFNERNPQPEVGVFHLSPRAGRAHIETRIRLSTSQHLVAVARLGDGSAWSDRREVIVTIAACAEEN
jgi:sulfur-oxidizing protein SoxY